MGTNLEGICSESEKRFKGLNWFKVAISVKELGLNG